jgi:hypothetical protein
VTDSIWPGLLIWVALYISDYWCTLTCARMYERGVRDVVAFEGSYELTPYYQKDVDALRWMSPRFVAALVASIGLLVALWSASRQSFEGAYAFGLGALVLVEAAVHVRHARNLYIFRRILAPDGVSGRIEYARSFALGLSGLELLGFALAYLAAWLADPTAFLAEGVVGCLSLAAQHMLRARGRPGSAGVAPQ